MQKCCSCFSMSNSFQNSCHHQSRPPKTVSIFIHFLWAPKLLLYYFCTTFSYWTSVSLCGCLCLALYHYRLLILCIVCLIWLYVSMYAWKHFTARKCNLAVGVVTYDFGHHSIEKYPASLNRLFCNFGHRRRTLSTDAYSLSAWIR